MIVKRPLIWFSLAFIVGMGLNKSHPFLIFLILLVLSVLLITYLYKTININRLEFLSFSFLVFLPIFLFLGYTVMKQALLTHEMDGYFDDVISGEIIGKVKNIENKEDYQLLILEKCVISLNSLDILEKGSFRGSNEMQKTRPVNFFSNGIKVYNNSPVNFKIGNTISINGDIIKFQKATNPGQFDEYQYNKILKYDYKVYCDSLDIINNEYSLYRDSIYRLKERIFDVYDLLLPSKNSGVLSAMILGDKTTLDSDIKELYQTHGISHILAISGLHVSLIGLTLYNILRRLRLNTSLSSIISIIFIYSYGVLTNFSVSTTRAIIMLFTLLISKIIGRTYDILSAACLSGLLILINNPLQIYSTGFLLSFGAILGIALIYPIISNGLKINNKLLRNLFDNLLVSLSVQIMTLPILLYFFFEISTYSILFNIILLPFVSVIIILAIIAGIIGTLYLPLASFFLGGAYYILNFYEWILSIANYFPLHTLMIGQLSNKIIVIYYLILLLCVLLNYWRRTSYSGFLLFVLLIIFIPTRKSSLEVSFLDLGQGDGIFIESPSKTTYLIDGGSTSVKQVGKYRIIPFLKSKGIRSLDYVFISHFDEDHINGIFEIMDQMDVKGNSGNIGIKTLVLPNVFDQSSSLEDEMYLTCIKTAKEKGINVVYMEEGDYIIDGDLVIECLHPLGELYYFEKNASSLVISVNYIEFDMLLTGDLEGIGEDRLNEVLNTGKSEDETNKYTSFDILKVAHHGSKKSTFDPFLNIVRPKYSVISAGKDNSYGHPHEELLLRLENVGSKIYTTINDGAITVYSDGKLMKIEVFID